MVKPCRWNTTDFNGDGFADLALMEVFPMNTDTFFFPGTAVIARRPRAISSTRIASGSLPFTGPIFTLNANPPAIGDFNHDGYLDVAFSAIAFYPPEMVVQPFLCR